MRTYATNEIKNVVLLGASGSGKTTLAEAMAFDGKVIDRRGTIESENTLSDYTEVEHLYKRSIYTTILFAEYNGRKLNIFDTPGSDDFCGGLFSAFKVADVGVMLLNAQNGFEVGTEIQARYARKHEKPIIAVINQLDSGKGLVGEYARVSAGGLAGEARDRAVSGESRSELRCIHRRVADEDV